MEFTGKEAHASVAPWEGVNALVCLRLISIDSLMVARMLLYLLIHQYLPYDNSLDLEIKFVLFVKTTIFR